VSALHRTDPAPPVRIVHLGLGAFSRSHLAWYTAHAADAAQWGIAAYTGRSAALADALTAQHGLYTLVTRGADGDETEVVDSIVRTRPGDDVTSLIGDIAAPATAIVSLTITEAGYRAAPSGAPDQSDPLIVADRAVLATLGDDVAGAHRLQTAPGRLAAALDARRRAGGGPLAVVSCDNLPDNGGIAARVVAGMLASVSDAAVAWCAENVSFVSGSVDRITPRLAPEESARLSAQLDDAAPVVTEPFSDWVLSGAFPAGRPDWESAGARVVADLEPWEARKLWLLNGAHTILANLGPRRGHAVVSEAIADAECRTAVEAFWDEAAVHLPAELEIDAYRAALLDRFANPRIAHALAQIALDTPTKLRLRIAPVAERERAAGRRAIGSARAFAACLDDAPDDQLRMRLRAASPALADDAAFFADVVCARDDLRTHAARTLEETR